MACPAIAIQNLTLAHGSHTLFRGFSLSIEPGEKILLAGPSGSGKSSLLACLMGLQVPAAGCIAIEGVGLNAKTIWTLRRRMALVQQEPDPGPQSVREWLEEPFAFRANQGLRRNLERLPDWLAELRLSPGILQQQGGDLSGGEKQRMALVSALLLERPILLLDEPTSALDEDARQAVYACLARQQQVAMLVVSHDSGPGWTFLHRTVRLPGREDSHGGD